ncbi:ABC transporter permease subunit [Serinibacter salmoneus]|uniref:ABC-2 type transport system permease protein n=1 Tax=Serinibacter salmoneus TaxID=556530 RepID=A0A2A9D244_9MICO|nr:ABC transporter permease subunit [Serinibacter salmoneus]PFG20441.1 ABC-2 type transport system permease protein [Serinibacter salmoneus]
MTTTVSDRSPAPSSAGTGGVTFPRLLRSEWLKLITLRSTWWSLGITVLAMMGLAAIFAASISFIPEDEATGISELGAQVITFGYYFAQVTVAVLGALVITGEYSTGMIRSTMTAAPHRITVLAAKALVLAIVVFVIGILATLLSWVITMPLLPDGMSVDIAAGETWEVILGAGVYLTLVALMAFGLGTIVRSSAGAIAAVLGIVLILPIIFTVLLGTGQDWAIDLYPYLPSAAGERLMATSGGDAMATDPAAGGFAGMTQLDPWVGGLVMLGYVAVIGLIGAVLVRRRDV